MINKMKPFFIPYLEGVVLIFYSTTWSSGLHLPVINTEGVAGGNILIFAT